MSVGGPYLTHLTPNPTRDQIIDNGLNLSSNLHVSSRDLLIVGDLRENFLYWKKQIHTFLKRKNIDRGQISKIEEENADSGNILRGGSVFGRPLTDDRILKSLEAEVSRLLSILRDAEQDQCSKKGLALAGHNDKNFNVSYNGKKSGKPFSKRDQYAAVLEFILLQPIEQQGVPFVISWDAVWGDLLARHKKNPFTKAPAPKKKSDIKKSVIRHLDRVTKELRNRFSQITEGESLFENISGGVIRRDMG